MEWNALVSFSLPAGGRAMRSKKAGTNGINISRAFPDPYSGFTRLMHGDYVPPKGGQLGHPQGRQAR